MRSGQRPRSAPDLIRREERGTLAALGDFIEWIGLIRRLQDMIDQANMRYRAPEVASFSLLLLLAVYFRFRTVHFDFAGEADTGTRDRCDAIVVILTKRKKRLAKFEQQLPDSIDLFNRSMKAGHNIHAGLETIASESPDPARHEFRKVVEEMALGMQVDGRSP